jgi:hypothetical protein
MFFRVMKVWIPLAVAATCAIGFAYLVGQQSWRLGVDGMSEQLASDGSVAVAAGADPESVAGTGTVDIATSIAPWVVVFGKDGKPVAGSGLLDGKLAQPPAGVFKSAQDGGPHGDRVTWQPRQGIREAIVVHTVKSGPGGFVVAGRSLHEAEAQIDTLGMLAAAAWLATMAASLFAVWLMEWLVGSGRAAQAD